VGTVAGEVRALLKDPFALSLPRDEPLTALRYFLAALFACRLARESGWPRWAAALALAAAAGALEASQILLESRSVSFQDAAAAWLGVAAGALASVAGGVDASRNRGAAAAALIAATVAAVLVAGLHPFRFQGQASAFQWLPFLAEYEKTSFVALANTLDAALVWFPLAFLLGRLYAPAAWPAYAALGVALATALGAEAVQPFVEGRYGDVTDVIGAGLGSLAGTLALRNREGMATFPAR
jgi:VanZ family protein